MVKTMINNRTPAVNCIKPSKTLVHPAIVVKLWKFPEYIGYSSETWVKSKQNNCKLSQTMEICGESETEFV